MLGRFTNPRHEPELNVTEPNDHLLANPKRELNFLFVKNKFCAELTLENPTKSNVIYRIRTTAAKSYIVTPNSGVIAPEETKKIQIFMPYQSQVIDRAHDKFLVQAFSYEWKSNEHQAKNINNVSDLFSSEDTLPSKNLQYIKLKVYFQIDDTLINDLSLNNASTRSSNASERLSENSIDSRSQNEESKYATFNYKKNEIFSVSKFGYSPKEEEIESFDFRQLVDEKKAEMKQKIATRASQQIKQIPSTLKYNSGVNSRCIGLTNSEEKLKSWYAWRRGSAGLLNTDNNHNNENLSIYNEISDAISSVSSNQALMKTKFRNLEHKFQRQKNLLAKTMDQKKKYITELNTLKILQSSFVNNDSKEKLCIFFLIL